MSRKPSTRDLKHFVRRLEEDDIDEFVAQDAAEVDYCPYCGEPDFGLHSIERCKKTFDADCEADRKAEADWRTQAGEQLRRDLERDLELEIEEGLNRIELRSPADVLHLKFIQQTSRRDRD